MTKRLCAALLLVLAELANVAHSGGASDVALDEILFLMMSTTNKLTSPFFNWETRAIPSHRTWGHGLRLMYVMEDNELARQRFSRDACVAHRTGDHAFALVKCVGEPPVVLTPRCNGNYYGAEGPCCKFDEAINFVFNSSGLWQSSAGGGAPDGAEPHRHEQPEIKWLVFSDDDMYYRPAPLARLLSETGDPSVPRIFAPDKYYPLYGHEQRCKGVVWTSWMQPIFLNRAAVEQLAPAAAKFGTVATCAAFKVTHDVGVGVVVWMYGMTKHMIPNYADNSELRLIKNSSLMVHGVRDDPKHLNFSTVHAHFARHGDAPADIRFFPQPKREVALHGYNTTAHARRHPLAALREPGAPYHPFTPDDCESEQRLLNASWSLAAAEAEAAAAQAAVAEARGGAAATRAAHAAVRHRRDRRRLSFGGGGDPSLADADADADADDASPDHCHGHAWCMGASRLGV